MKTVTIHQYPMGTPPLTFKNVVSYDAVYMGEFTYLKINGVDFGVSKLPYEAYIPLGNVIQIDAEGEVDVD